MAVDLRDTEAHPEQALRLLCLGDVARRVSEEVDRVPARLVVLGGEKGLRQSARELGVSIYDRDIILPSRASSLDVDVLLTPAGRDAGDTGVARSSRTYLVATVSTSRPVTSPGRNITGMAGPPRAEADGLVERLALIRPHPWEVFRLSHARERRSAQTLERWRFKVSSWKDMPVAPAPPAALEEVHRVLVAALDTGTVLQILHRMEVDHEVPSGAKFSMFVTVDRILGLDLKRMLGPARWISRSG